MCERVRVAVIVPLHVSGIWVPFYSDNPLETGSIGAGLNLTTYLRAVVRRDRCGILVNNRDAYAEQAERICKEAGVGVEVNAYTPFSLGRGFGVSAATLIAHAVAAYKTADRPLLRALQLAHILEVEYKTGLGDVIAEYLGGFVVRLKPGAPGFGVAYRIIPRERADFVVVELEASEPTFAMLKRMGSEEYELGRRLLERVVNNEDLATFFECSRAFTSRLFDYSRIRDTVNGLYGVIDYYVKKSALVLWVEKDYVAEVISRLRDKGARAFYATISNVGVVLVHPARSSKEGEFTDPRENR